MIWMAKLAHYYLWEISLVQVAEARLKLHTEVLEPEVEAEVVEAEYHHVIFHQPP